MSEQNRPDMISFSGLNRMSRMMLPGNAFFERIEEGRDF